MAKEYKRKSIIYISHEGAVTEREYINILKKEFIYKNYAIKILGQRRNQSDPKSILKSHKNNMITTGPNQNLFEDDYEVIIFDKEAPGVIDQSHFKELIKWQKEKQSSRLLIPSSPTFEYWLLYHFEDKPGTLTPKETRDKLKREWPNYQKRLNRSYFNRDKIIEAAGRNKLQDASKNLLIYDDCGSDMYKLIDLLVKLKKNSVKSKILCKISSTMLTT